ncbi:hypothetical protein DV515_00014419 [Chloebia gouldiae]|uniref:Uncharacterized protein n=1 Tax=Chloebia gouldiae TaxID=44316 RepID=A0A3L8RYG1_CHLGU|nr:hypothetical protein DV515_00014419 [Chloebia gouldiae]
MSGKTWKSFPALALRCPHRILFLFHVHSSFAFVESPSSLFPLLVQLSCSRAVLCPWGHQMGSKCVLQQPSDAWRCHQDWLSLCREFQGCCHSRDLWKLGSGESWNLGTTTQTPDGLGAADVAQGVCLPSFLLALPKDAVLDQPLSHRWDANLPSQIPPSQWLCCASPSSCWHNRKIPVQP